MGKNLIKIYFNFKMEYQKQEASLLILIGECFVDNYKDEEKFEAMKTLCNQYIRNVYNNCIVCNPIILEHAFNYCTFYKAPYIYGKIMKDKQVLKKFDRFIEKNKFPKQNKSLKKLDLVNR